MQRRALVLGSGFTGFRVAQFLLVQDWQVRATNRNVLDVNDAASLERWGKSIGPEVVVLHSIPVPGVMEMLRKNPPARVVYLSTTGVYGAATMGDETTPGAPRTERELLRVEEERQVLDGPWSSLILRPAAIYGPGRGIHASMREGNYHLSGDGTNFVSRIHVDDLARITAAAMVSDLIGAYPVADDEPCTSREIAEYCAKLLNLPLPETASPESLGETRRADRRVNGSAIRRLLGVTLHYPNYRAGIAATLEVEARAFSTS